MHPNGYHKSEQAKERCWSCSHPQNLMPTEEDYKVARQLVAAGWLSVSNRYRHLARYAVPKAEQILKPEYLGTHIEEDLREFLRRQASIWTRMRGEVIEVTPQVFYAFKKIGGQST